MMHKTGINEIVSIIKQMESHFIRNNYSSFDPCDIKALPWIMKYYSVFYKKSYSKFAIYPLERVIEKFPGFIRNVAKIKKRRYAQASALIVRGKIILYRWLNDSQYLDTAKEMLDWIIEQKTEQTQYTSWGQPYNWFSKEVIPADTPRTTVTSQMLHTFIDIYQETKEGKWYHVIQDICNFFLFEMKRSYESEQEICFSYTTTDNYKVHNANMMAASALYRAGKVLSKPEISELAWKCLTFTMNRQNHDGSWYYYELENNIPSKIDNYHSGYILEALAVIKGIEEDKFVYNDNFNNGIDYYIRNFFNNNHIPKITPGSLYPMDIQSCAQSLITLVYLSRYRNDCTSLAENVVNFTLENFYSDEGWFFYRIEKNSHVNKNSYIRWGDAWMYLGLIRYLTMLKNE